MISTEHTCIVGVIFLHSDIGTEGRYWAFQDSRFISPNTTRYSCTKCGLVWDSELHTKDQLLQEITSSNFMHDTHQTCEHEFTLSPPILWSYNGLHVLQDGDYLTIHDVDGEAVLWEGNISLKYYPLYTELVHGYWIHSDQIGVEREQWANWFIHKHPATLKPSQT